MNKEPLLPNNLYHIYNRGNNKELIFKEPKNYQHFLNLWKNHINPIADSLVYSLQPNHFHFLIRTKGLEEDEKQSKILQQSFANFFNTYSKSINKAYNRTGSLFQERFGRKIIIRIRRSITSFSISGIIHIVLIRPFFPVSQPICLEMKF